MPTSGKGDFREANRFFHAGAERLRPRVTVVPGTTPTRGEAVVTRVAAVGAS